MFVTLLVPSNDKRLLGGGGVAASPFVIAVQDAGVPGIGHILNGGMIIGILAISAESVYLSSRVLRCMAHKKLVPELFARVDDKGRPRWALFVTGFTAVIFTYMNLSAGGITALNWFVNITSSCFFANWLIIAFTSFRFHAALKAQNDGLFGETYAWKSTKWPVAPVWLATISLLILSGCLAAAIKPLGSAAFTAENFLGYMIGIVIIIVGTIGFKLIMRTKWVDPATADLKTGRRTLDTEEIKQLDDYYQMPKWRRFLTYVQLW